MRLLHCPHLESWLGNLIPHLHFIYGTIHHLPPPSFDIEDCHRRNIPLFNCFYSVTHWFATRMSSALRPHLPYWTSHPLQILPPSYYCPLPSNKASKCFGNSFMELSTPVNKICQPEISMLLDTHPYRPFNKVFLFWESSIRNNPRPSSVQILGRWVVLSFLKSSWNCRYGLLTKCLIKQILWTRFEPFGIWCAWMQVDLCVIIL